MVGALLTEHHEAILGGLREFTAHRYAPSPRDLATALGLPLETLLEALVELQRQGRIRIDKTSSPGPATSAEDQLLHAQAQARIRDLEQENKELRDVVSLLEKELIAKQARRAKLKKQVNDLFEKCRLMEVRLEDRVEPGRCPCGRISYEVYCVCGRRLA